MKTDGFVDWFRSSAPYIHAHRGRTFVVVFGGEMLRGEQLKSFVHDIALLHALGIRLVLVAGARPQIDERIQRGGKKPVYHKGVRVTDEFAMRCAKEAAGTNRVELEALLSMGLPNSPMAGARLRVATGNFVTARPLGVLDGVDYQYTGAVRKVDGQAMRALLDDGCVIILSPIGYSPTGEAFNASSPDVAAEAAIAVGADKLICLVDSKGIVDSKGRTLHEVPTAQAAKLLTRKTLSADLKRYVQAAVRACENGVRRAHFLHRKIDGALLRELFSRDGVGTLVTTEAFEGMRAARMRDVPGLLALLEPLEQRGILVHRTKEMLERDVHRFVVIERDGMIVGCAAIYPFVEEKTAEIACVAVHPTYQGTGRGDQMIEYCERLCREQGMERIFVLTTQTAHWFRELGFAPASTRSLPKSRRARYDKTRRSKVLVKSLRE